MRSIALPPVLLVALLLVGCSVDREPGPAVLFVVPVGLEAERPDEAAEAVVARVELAYDEDSRQRGLMNRPSLAPDTGMLFIYPAQRELGFWMKNTLIRLSICYADSSGRIVRILDMEPDPDPGGGNGRDLPRYYSEAPALYALEMEAGWFERKGIREGGQILFHPSILTIEPR